MDRRAVAWTPAALASVDEICAGIDAQGRPKTARKVLDAFDSAADSLVTMPYRGRVTPELDEPTIRELFVYRYRLLYQVSDEQIRVLAVIHGAMNFAAAIHKEPP